MPWNPFGLNIRFFSHCFRPGMPRVSGKKRSFNTLFKRVFLASCHMLSSSFVLIVCNHRFRSFLIQLKGSFRIDSHKYSPLANQPHCSKVISVVKEGRNEKLTSFLPLTSLKRMQAFQGSAVFPLGHPISLSQGYDHPTVQCSISRADAIFRFLKSYHFQSSGSLVAVVFALSFTVFEKSRVMGKQGCYRSRKHGSQSVGAAKSAGVGRLGSRTTGRIRGAEQLKDQTKNQLKKPQSSSRIYFSRNESGSTGAQSIDRKSCFPTKKNRSKEFYSQFTGAP